MNIRLETIDDMLDLKDLLNKHMTRETRNNLCMIRSKINSRRYESDEYNYFFSILEEDDLEICNLCKNYYCNSSSCHTYQDDNQDYEDYSYHDNSDHDIEYDNFDYLVEDIYLYDDYDY